MSHKFKVGDHVTWNSEAGKVGGTISKIHTHDFDYKGHIAHPKMTLNTKSKAIKPIISPRTKSQH